VSIDSVEETLEETEREIAKLREQAEKQTRKARDGAARVIVGMVKAGAKPDEVAARLGVTVREVKKAVKETSAAVSSEEASGSVEDSDHDDQIADRRDDGVRLLRDGR
jgi:DNA-directed RNA polymerase specialized sigma subunit